MTRTTADELYDALALGDAQRVLWNPVAAALYEETIRHDLGRISLGGPMVVNTAPYTGRSPGDKFVVRARR